MEDSGFNFRWLAELVNSFPELSERRKNFFDISGFPRWENVNSNLLAFYLDKKEEHGFKTLFLESILELIKDKTPNLIGDIDIETDYVVEREFVSNRGNRIDILIKAYDESWAIIIENKVDAVLDNDLLDYWDSTKADKKCGIVLSVELVKYDNDKFVNITHKELIEKVVANLGSFYTDSNDKHLLFLKEYISCVKSFYKDSVEVKKMEQILEKFQDNKENLKRLKRIDAKLHEFITTTVDDILKSLGLNPASSNKAALSRHFEFNKQFRFWVDYEQIKFDNKFLGFFELFGKENTEKGEKLKNELEQNGMFNDKVKRGTGGRPGGSYCHIYKISISLGDFNNGFAEHLKKQLEDHFFSKNYLNEAVSEFDKLIENEN
jgi:hypothetical protein